MSKKSVETLNAELAVLNDAISRLDVVGIALKKKQSIVEAKIAKQLAPTTNVPTKPRRTLAQMRDAARQKNK